MYTNPSNLAKTYANLLERNKDTINSVIKEYEQRELNVFVGMRKSLPRDAFPSLELEPTSASSEWYACRTQRPRFNLQFTLTVVNDNEDFGVEYISTIVTVLTEILTNPLNLQMKIVNETKWSPNWGLVDSYIMDSLVEDVTYNSNHDGTIRTAEFNVFALVLEPYPESDWNLGNRSEPTQVRQSVKPA